MSMKKINQLLAIPLLVLFFQSGAVAQPLFLPGFFGLSEPYIEAPEIGSDSVNAYFTFMNFYYEPVLLLSAESEAFGSIAFYDGSEELEFVEIQPGYQLTMSADGTHIRLTDIDDTMADMESFDLTLLIRRGYEAEEFVEEYVIFNNNQEIKKGGGIPNESEHVVKFSVKH